MIRVIRVVSGSIFLVVSAEPHRPPTPFLGTDYDGAWIGGFDGSRISLDVGPQLIVRFRSRMSIAMSAAPDGGLVVELIVFDTGGCRRISPLADQMVDPCFLDGGAVGHIGVFGVVDDVIARGGADAITSIRLPLVGARLRAVLGNGEGPKRGRVAGCIGSDLGDVGKHRNRDHWLGSHVGGVSRLNEIVGVRSRHDWRPVQEIALVIPVSVQVPRVLLPVVIAGVVATVAVERGVQSGKVGGTNPRNSVDVGVDGMLVRARVHADGSRRVGGV